MRTSGVLVALALGLAAPTASGAEGDPAVSASCGAEPGSGRVVCRVELVAPAGEKIRWADVLVRETPAQVKPLRSRVLATVEPKGERSEAVFGLVVAPGASSGAVRLQARGVLCREDDCRSVVLSTEAALPSL